MADFPCCDQDADFDAMARCQRCNRWFHFCCVGLDDSVEAYEWYCALCLGEDESIRSSLGAPGNTRIRRQPDRAAKHKGKGGVCANGNGKSSDLVNPEAEIPAKSSRAISQKDRNKDIDELGEKVDSEIDLSNISPPFTLSNCSVHGRSTHVRRNGRELSMASRNSCGSQKSSESNRARARQELKDLEEKSRLEEMKDKNELKLFIWEQKRIKRLEHNLMRRQQLRELADGGSESEEDDVLGNDERDYRRKVEGWLTSGAKRQSDETFLKNTGAIPKIPRKTVTGRLGQDILNRTAPASKEQKSMLDQADPAKRYSKLSSCRSPVVIGGSSFSNFRTPLFEDDDDFFRSYFDLRGPANEKERRSHQIIQQSSGIEEGPTRLQIASRHVYPRSLPAFTGRPEDWPVFISAFEQANRSCGFTNAENLVRLQEALKGKALELVRNRLLLPENVPTIIEKLRRRFGNPEILSTMMARKIQQLKGPSLESLESLIEFGSAVEEFTQHLKASKLTDHLKNPILMQSLVQKLPSYYALAWVEYKRRVDVVDLQTFGCFMEELVDVALDATFERGCDEDRSNKKEKPRTKGFVNMTEENFLSSSCCQSKPRIVSQGPTSSVSCQTQTWRETLKCAICQVSGHFSRVCNEFQKQNVDDRWKTVERLGICPLCLYNHGRKSCISRNRCRVEGCREKHNELLHRVSSEGSPRLETQFSSHHQHKAAVLFRVLPVWLFNGRKKLRTLALIDEGSSVTMIDNELAQQLNADGPLEPLQMCWTNGVSRTEKQSRKLELEVSSTQTEGRFPLLNVRTVSKLDLPMQSLSKKKLLEEFEHLRDLDIVSYEIGTPKVLIGIDNLHLIAPLDSRVRDFGEPIAVRCRLGWTVYGPHPNMVSRVHFLGHHRCYCEECSKSDHQMHEALKEYFQLEEVGVSAEQLESGDDRRAKNILEATTKRVGERFETGLLWKEENVGFPESFQMALKRLKSLERRMDRNTGVRDKVIQQLKEYTVKGYAHRITEEEISNTPREKVWFLPLNYVVNPKKPEKIRLVWDAAAKVQNVSLNDKLLQGPDMLTSLPAVINGFRERRVAFGGDIKEMFHQIRVRPEDRQAQRFLFRSDSSRDPDVYVMDVVIFGASCSPSSAQYVKNLNARAHAEEYPEASAAIIKKHYVDDYFDSADTVEEAVKLAKDVRTVHAKGGFEIRNWVSNSKEVLQDLGATGPNEAKSMDVAKVTDSERVLGVIWNPVEDAFVFKTDMREDLQPYIREGAWPTKRIALRCIMSMFDPKQFLAPLLIHGRILMQDLWRSGIGWDEKLPEKHFEQWLRWTQLFPLIEKVRVPRCYLGELGSEAYNGVQLHVFTDAGEDAYGCVAYFRFEYGGVVHCAFVEAKAKVAPLQHLSIPRKELEAALLGARMMNGICKNHSFPITERYMWTDSNAVATWVKAELRRYKEYVKHRIAKIQILTSPDEWRWVPTKCNPADDVTKWGKATELSSDSPWFRGPDFLYESKEKWPQQKQPAVEIEEELRASVLLHEIMLPDGLLHRIDKISRWNVLVRTLATVHRFVSNCKRRVHNMDIELLPSLELDNRNPENKVPLRQEEYLAAENCLWRGAQAEEFPDEVKILIKNRELPAGSEMRLEKSSPLYQLTPFIDEFGVIRMDGRTEAAEYSEFDAKFPIILPKKHAVTRKMVEHYHQLKGHGSRELVVNEIRQRFYVPCLKAMVDKVMRECQWCKVRKAKPSIPRMAPLPEQRLAMYANPFSYVGLDYFGPLEVTVGRRKVKRWVALFTCMTVRAVHLEVAHSLTTESCKMAIRRFVKKCGSPVQIWSDNGTNFHGADRELTKQIRRINVDCADTFTSARTRWTFNPPSAPHMGGVWERMVRSVKEALKVLVDDMKLDDEILLTALAEAQDLINSRPLTYVSTNVAEDSEALTPNHFLRGRSSVDCLPSRNPVASADTLRSSYNRSQFLADEYWLRWQREYLPGLNKRSKWFVDHKQVAVGDLVFVADGEKQSSWERGIVQKVNVGNDGRVRSAIVKTSSGPPKKRPVSKLAVLECGE